MPMTGLGQFLLPKCELPTARLAIGTGPSHKKRASLRQRLKEGDAEFRLQKGDPLNQIRIAS